MLASSTWFLDHAWIIVAIPALSFVVILLFGRRLPKKGSEVGITAVGASFVLACVAAVQWIQRLDDAGHGGHGSEALRSFGRSILASSGGHELPGVGPVVSGFSFKFGLTQIQVGTQMDGLAVMMVFVVALISLLVHVYSTAYMHGDRRYTFFYAALSLFTASMLLLVVSDNTLQLLVGWELVGLCSFMLIGHWWEEQANSDAALKAFFTTRVGDIGLVIGIIVTFFAAGQTFDITAINVAALDELGGHTIWLVAAVGLMFGIIGKSGQFPLHTWLPDAMAGPTPVSALIHAATMVVAGVYLGARLYGVFWEGYSIGDGGMNFMALIGGITILIGALLAFVQDDIKKVLAYSTISQLGYMVMGLGVGAWVAAIFHLFTHAFFKALLFLGAGSVSHSGAHHSFDMKKDMGGLRHSMPITFWTFMIGTVALAGIFPFAGFWSKDEILATAGTTGFDTFMVVGLVGAFLTAAYMTRCVYLTFFGEYRGHGEPHESSPAITVPLIVLAAFSVVAGWINATAIDVEKFKEWVEPRVAFPLVEHAEFSYSKAGISVAMALFGATLAWLYYSGRLELLKGLTTRSRPARAGYTFLLEKYYLDHLYTGVIVGAIKKPIARVSYWVDQNVLDGAVNGAGWITRRAAGFVYGMVDQQVVDGAVNGIAEVTDEGGGLLRKVQSGRLPRYALGLFAAVVVLSVFIVLLNVYVFDNI